MSANFTLEQRIRAVMAEEAMARPPAGALDDILTTTSHAAPRPRWLVLLKEPPMHLHAQVAVGSPTRRLALALAAALVLAGVLGVAGAVLLARSNVSADWPMFRGDAARSGSAQQGPIGHPAIRWRYQAAGAMSKNISIIGTTVYAAADDGVLHAADLTSGAERWHAALHGPTTGPSVVDGSIYLADGNGLPMALDATTGAVRWQSTVAIVAPSNPTVGSGAIYFGSGDGQLVAVDATTGKERWRVPVSPGAGLGTPGFADGTVYVGGAGTFLAVDAASGTVRWRFDTGPDRTGTAVVADGIVYIGANADESANGHLWALDASTGAVRWQLGHPYQAPAVAGTVAYVSDTTGGVAALDTKTGRTIWQVQLTGVVRAPAVAAGIVYVAADSEHRVYAMDATTGGLLWQLPVDSGIECCIAVADGSVFVGTTLGGIYAIGGDGLPLVAVLQSPRPSVTPSSPSPTAVASLPPPPAAVAWQGSGSDGKLDPNGLVMDPKGHIWAADPYNERFAIFESNGTFDGYWGTQGSGNGQFELRRANGDGYGAVAFEPDGSFYVLDVGNHRVQAFDPNRNFVKAWGGFGVDPGKYNDPVGIAVAPDHTILVLDDVRGVVERYAPDGHVIGSFNAFPNAETGLNTSNALAVDAAGNIYVSDISPYQIDRFDPTGKLTLTFGSEGTGPGQFTDQPGSIAVDATGRIFVDQGAGRANGPGILVFDSAGRYLTGFATRAPGPVQIDWPTGLLLDGSGALYVGDAVSLEDPGKPSQLVRLNLLPPLAP